MQHKEGEYVYHPEYGIGRIRQILPGNNPDLKIDFEKRSDKFYSMDWVNRETMPVAADGFRAMAYDNHEAAVQLLHQDRVRAFALVLTDFPGQRAKNEELKEYLSRYVKWDEWWAETQPLLKEAEYIDTSRSKQREYGLREHALSHTEEAFDRFQRSRLSGNKRDIYEQALRVLTVHNAGQPLSDASRVQLVAYFQQVLQDPAWRSEERIETAFRLLDSGWLADAEVDRRLHELTHQAVQLVQLSEYARTRLIDFLARNRPDEIEQQLLISGICAEEHIIKRVLDWGRKQESATLLAILRVGLTEGLSHSALSFRFEQLIGLVRYLPTSLTNWPEVSEWLIAAIAQLARSVPKAGVSAIQPALLKLSHGVFSQAGGVASPVAKTLVAGLVDLSYPSSFVESIWLTAQTLPELSADFVQALLDQALCAAGSENAPLLTTLSSHSAKTTSDQIHTLTEYAVKYHAQNPKLISPIGEQVRALLPTVSTFELAAILSALDTLAMLGQDSPWIEPLNEYRKRGYFTRLEASLDQPAENVQAFGKVDQALLRAIQEVVQQEKVSLQDKVGQLQTEIDQLEQQIRALSLQLSERDIAFGELRQERGKSVEAAQYEERFRILRELAQTTAEIERFSARQVAPSPETKGVLSRLGNILRTNKVEVRAPLGALIAFDSAFCQMVEGKPIESGSQVQVIESGYTIKDPKSLKQLLKPAMVKAV